MPVVAHSSLPTFERLRQRGAEIVTLDEAHHQDIRELHIGLLNMMPDGAFRVTEEQFIRLIGSANQIVQVFVHPFTVKGAPRADEVQAHIDAHYETFEQLQAAGLDALVVTGANPASSRLEQEPFWEPLQEVMGWATEHVTSVLCSCLATHALLQHTHGIERRPLTAKRWGVYEHRAVRPDHPLLLGTNTRFDVPHSRWNEITATQVRDADLEVLVESIEGEFHLATSPDGIRMVYLQGHPEYDAVSLLKEYKRELARMLDGELDGAPPLPANYLSPAAASILREHVHAAQRATDDGAEPPAFPEQVLAGMIDNTWTDTGRAHFNNWLGLVYRLTNLERGIPFMDGIDPADPLGLIAAHS